MGMGMGGELETKSSDVSAPTETTKTKERPKTLSERTWNFSWDDHLPATIGSRGITIELSSFDEVYEYARENFDRIFELDKKHNPFVHWEDKGVKERYYRETMDVFVVKREGTLIGINVCGPSDWSSYYLRHSSVLPEAQGNMALSGFIQFIIDKMEQLGVKRLQAETSPANLPIIQILTRLRFNLAGMQLTERWGAIMLLTKFLDKKNEGVFLDQFCFGNHPQASESH